MDAAGFHWPPVGGRQKNILPKHEKILQPVLLGRIFVFLHIICLPRRSVKEAGDWTVLTSCPEQNTTSTGMALQENTTLVESHQ